MTMTGNRPTRLALPHEVMTLIRSYPTSVEIEEAAADLCATGHADRIRLMHWLADETATGRLWADGKPS